jgi:hypothetical protein
MSRLGGFWIGMAIVTGVANYGLKQMVQGTANDLASVQRKTIAEQKEIHELQADWTFLNQPELLADLNKRYIGLTPVSPKQVGVPVDNIPMRPIAPQPQPEPPIAALDAPAAAPVAEVTPLDQPEPQPAVVAAPRTVPATPAAAAPLPIVRAAAIAPSPAVLHVAAASTPASTPGSLDALFAQVAGDR